ncbi:MAG: hypothetical protein IJJ80_04920 [Clostridia bacterium]|nr:hypothetical protein [Clostridia bacterium]
MTGQMSIFDLGGERHGKWEKHHDNARVMMRCTACESQVLGVDYAQAIGQSGWKFCPYCGARMENPDEFRRKWPNHISREWQEEERRLAAMP